MASPRRFLIVRFSLRTLFLAISAVCIFLGYELNWIHQRRAFLREQVTRDEVHWSYMSDVFRRTDGQEHPPEWQYYSNKPAPYLLWLFGETSLPALYVLVPKSDATVNSHHLIDKRYIPNYISRKQTDYRLAERLFPESEIHVYVMGAGHALAISENAYKSEVEKTRLQLEKMKLEKASGGQPVAEVAEQ